MAEKDPAGQEMTKAPAPAADQTDPDREQPADAIPDIEAVAAYEKRLKGLQAVIGKKDTELQTTRRQIEELQRRIEELELASMPDEERAKHLSQRTAEEIARLRRENALLRLRAEHPDGVSLFEQLQSAQTAEEQIALLDELAKGRKPADQESSSGVDENNPPRELSTGFDLDAMHEKDAGALADRILRGFRRMPR